MKKNILLVGLNARYTHTALGIYSIKAYLKSKNIDVCAVEYTINDNYENTFYDIVHREPDIIGFSTYIWNIELVKRLITDIKSINPEIL